ncbi:P-loop containing nucleoside triphosphate hydrolase protein [Gymnopus androsaceus JB14]|uniref:P-loop containing nucleoside triphosphate hydrolase protein n=1 Tax=Gymnopus androsaceus JB14 TaxID=1447944 RepID=A0A6A4HF97_9AGAR|nr:P-loop containing nucleoside triphosphate hydrolase protein [Gymnopus androsaceus JB14]
MSVEWSELSLSSQTVLNTGFSPAHSVYPLYATVASTLVLLLHVIADTIHVRKLFRRPNVGIASEELSAHTQAESLVQGIKVHIGKHGGAIIFACMVARLVGTLALLCLSIATLILDEFERAGSQDGGDADILGKWGNKYPTNRYSTQFSNRRMLYASFLALVSLAARLRWSRVVIRHLNLVLLVTLCVYLYRDVYPLATFLLDPKDLSEGGILWVKVTILIIHCCGNPTRQVPRPYVPVDPKNPLPRPNPEQTASIFSLITYAFLDPLVFAAYRVAHLSFDKLPPLNDHDAAEHLKGTKFQGKIASRDHLDLFSGAPKRHLFFGFMRIFSKDYIQLAFMILLHVFANFAAPIGLNRLLRYLEPGGQDAVVRPWVWILWLFIGPVGGTIAIQWYIFVATRTLARTQAIVTQLVFEHSLRIRVKAEAADSSESSTFSSSETLTPDSASLLRSKPGCASSVSSVKSKSKKGKKAKQDDPPQSDANNLVGKINNLTSSSIVLYIPVQIVLCMIFLYILLGWSSFVGLAVMIVSFPLPGYIARKVQIFQEKRLKKTDARVQSVSESMNVLRMIKLFGWECRMDAKIAEKRDEELIWIRRRQVLEVFNGILTYVIPLLTMIVTFVTFTVIMKGTMRASVIFSSMSVFDMLREQMRIIFRSINETMTAKVSLDRTELLDSLSEKIPESGYFVPADQVTDSQEIGFRDATFTWSSDVAGSLTPSKRKFKLKIEGELLFRKNCVNLIIGETGSGKTSLLMALLSEMHFIPSGPESWYNLPRDAGIAYAAQESWVQNETIRENIVFGSPFDEERYKKVIYQCGLERDITLFEAGDATEVGEKGLTLSGGQKARITLARAIYSVHTSKWIVDKCFTGDLMDGRTMILVTHNIAITRPIAGFVVALKEGRIESQGTVSEALGKDPVLAEEARIEQQVIDKTGEEVDDQRPPEETKGDGKLIVAEEIQEGHVSWSAVKMYLTSMGGQYSWAFFLAFIFTMFVTEVLNALQTWYLGYWASQYESQDAASVSVFHAMIIYTIGVLIYVFGTIRASRAIHKELIASIFGAGDTENTLAHDLTRWLDTTPTSRVIARCTQDIRAVDGPVPQWLQALSELSAMMILKYTAVVIITPIFVIPGVLVAVLGAACGQVYIKAQLSVKREMSNARAPVLGHFGAAIAGLTSIRAYGVQETFIAESIRRIDRYTRAARTYFNLNRWICIRIDALGALLAAGLAAYLVYYRGQTASNTGFSLNMAVGFSSLILWWVRTLNEFEVQGGLERIQGYINIEQEPKSNVEGVPPAYWPASGELRVEGLSARYSSDGPKVLHDISFSIKSGERVGVVGRTGSGKSSLTLSLLRCIFTEGKVYYDGVATDKINLDALRTSITIIPQVPELLSGTLRQNLDPFDQYDDAVLNDALRAAGLFALQNDMVEGRITLDSPISSGGGNLSVGQRQILALARALVRGSKLLILDEDYKTDSIIQDSLRNELKGDITLITVAHRLQTIMDADKIMVLDAGRIVEFDSPEALLKIKDGKLRSLVDESNDKDVLYAMAEKAHTTS